MGRFSARAIFFQLVDLHLFQVLGNNLVRQRVLWIESLQLQQQTLPQVPRAHSDGIKILHDGQRVFQIVLRIFAILQQLFDGSGEVAVFVQVADDVSAISLTVSEQMVTLSCQVRCSVSPLGEERNFSKEGRSEISRSCDCPPSPPVSRYWLKKLPTSNSSNGLASGFSGTFSVSVLQEIFVAVVVGGGRLFAQFFQDRIGDHLLVDHFASAPDGSAPER